MNIAIIEKDHFEVAGTLISMFDNGNNNITIFVEGESYRQLQLMLQEKTTHYHWVVKAKDESNRQFISRMFHILQEDTFDLIYFNTIDDNFILYAYYLEKLKSKNTVLTIHDINGFFDYKPSLSLRRLVRYIGKRYLVKTIPAFNILSETLITRLRSSLPTSKKIYTIPGSFFDSALFTAKTLSDADTISIVIPGSVDIRRRNYGLVFDLLQIARQRNNKISITLLGAFKKGYSEGIQKGCNEYLQTNDNLHIYQQDIVDQPEFDRVISESHFVWIPLTPFSIIKDGIKEQYGLSTCSGNVADIIRHAKPFFAPTQLQLESPMEISCCRYRTVDDIVTVLEQLSPSSYNTMQELAQRASLHYTKEKIINANAKLFPGIRQDHRNTAQHAG